MRSAMGCALMLATLSSAACHTTKLVTLDQAPTSRSVLLTLSDQSVVEVFGPQIYGNKLVGFVNGKYDEFPTAKVSQVQVREPARGRTTALVVAGVVGAAAAIYVAATSGLLQSAADQRIQDICDEEPDLPICM